MFEKILVPLDTTDLSEAVLPYVTTLARGLEARVGLLYVVDPDMLELPQSVAATGEGPAEGNFPELVGTARLPLPPEPAGGAGEESPPRHGPLHSITQVLDRVKQKATLRLTELAKGLEAKGVRADVLVGLGPPAAEIVRTVEEGGYDLVAMSTHARGLLAQGLLGSVTSRVIRTSRVPVLTFRPPEGVPVAEEDARLRTVLVALDGSSLAEEALPYAQELARRLGLKVVLVRVLKVGTFATEMDGYPYISTIPLDDQLEAQATRYLEGIGQRLQEAGLSVETRIRWGQPAEALVDEARETPGALVVMTTHGRSGISRLLLGSVTEKMVRSSGAPVLVVPPQAVAQKPPATG